MSRMTEKSQDERDDANQESDDDFNTKFGASTPRIKLTKPQRDAYASGVAAARVQYELGSKTRAAATKRSHSRQHS